jgi:hypothetical protein
VQGNDEKDSPSGIEKRLADCGRVIRDDQANDDSETDEDAECGG